jgi:hypothetical protein
LNDGIVELLADLVKVSGIVSKTWATGKRAVRIQKWHQVANVLMEVQTKTSSLAVHQGTDILPFS